MNQADRTVARGGRGARAFEALLRVVWEDIMHVAGQDFLLVALPEGRVEQVGMVRHEDLANRRVAEQERREGLGEDVLRADPVPDLARHLVFLVARLGHLAEGALGQVLDLVVVVEDDLAVAGDAEVLPQHVAGEDVGAHQVLDRVAVLDDDRGDLLGVASCR